MYMPRYLCMVIFKYDIRSDTGNIAINHKGVGKLALSVDIYTYSQAP